MFQHHPSVTISPFASEIIFGAKLLYTVYGQSKMKSLSVQQFMFTITRTTSNRRHQLVAVHVRLPKQSTAWFYCCYCCYLFVCSPVMIRLLFWVTTYLYLVMFTNPTLNKASKKHVINNVSDIIQSHWANDPSLWAALNILLLNISMPVGLWCFAEDDRKTVSAHWGLRGQRQIRVCRLHWCYFGVK